MIAYVDAREARADADTAKVLTRDEVRRVASNIMAARTTESQSLPMELLAKQRVQVTRGITILCSRQNPSFGGERPLKTAPMLGLPISSRRTLWFVR